MKHPLRTGNISHKFLLYEAVCLASVATLAQVLCFLYLGGSRVLSVCAARYGENTRGSYRGDQRHDTEGQDS